MNVKQMKSILATNKFDNIECNFKLKTKGPQVPAWFKEFYINEFKPLAETVIRMQTEAPAWFKDFEKRINNRFDKLEARIDNLESRIDNLVVKNNLKE